MVMARCESNNRVGLLGGTFDPVHNGHLQLAEVAARKLQLAKVLFIPAAVPPHKPDQRVTSYLHRARMIELALADIDGMEISTIEQFMPTPSYTIDTLMALKGMAGGEDFFYITGQDSFLEIDTWKSYDSLLQSVNFIVIARSGYQHRSIEIFLHNLGYLRDVEGWLNPAFGKRLFFIEEEVVDVSSSKIRALTLTCDERYSFLPESVCQYIQENDLYLS